MSSGILPLWRFLITDLAGSGITSLDHLASDRTVTPRLNEASEVTGTVPSNSDYVNRLHTDGSPALSEGVRQLYCFRRESDTPPYYTIRASTLVMQINDAAASDDARSRFTAWDPWQYLMSRPVLQSANATGGNYTTGNLIRSAGLIYGAAQTASFIVKDMIATTQAASLSGPTAARNCFIDATVASVGTFGTFVGGYTIQQGTSLGQALQEMCATGIMDILFNPIYDSTRPGILCEVVLMSQSSPDLGAGSFQYNAVFGWDRPRRSAVGMDDLFDGVGRANHIQFYAGQGGSPVAVQVSAASVAKYGEYWAQQFFPAENITAPVITLAIQQLGLRQNGKQTLTVNPASGRAPEPFFDYYLGDRVPVYASNRLRQPLPLGTDPVWQRVYGIPVDIDDNSVETVRELIVGPVDGPVIGPPPAAPRANPINSKVAITTARNTNRQGGVGP